MVSQIHSQSTRKDFTFADDFSHQMVRLFFIAAVYNFEEQPYHHQCQSCYSTPTTSCHGRRTINT
jgi:hypothetical protein